MFSKSLNANYPLKFIRLDPTNGVKAFNCGDVDLDDFILNRASNFQKHLLAVSYACVDVDDASKVYAYCSLANDRGGRWIISGIELNSTDFAKRAVFQTKNV